MCPALVKDNKQRMCHLHYSLTIYSDRCYSTNPLVTQGKETTGVHSKPSNLAFVADDVLSVYVNTEMNVNDT